MDKSLSIALEKGCRAAAGVMLISQSIRTRGYHTPKSHVLGGAVIGSITDPRRTANIRTIVRIYATP
jgi:hypothetical protein